MLNTEPQCAVLTTTLSDGRFPHDQLSRYRAAEYEKYLAAARLHQSNTRPLFPPSATPRPPVPSTPTPGSHSILAVSFVTSDHVHMFCEKVFFREAMSLMISKKS